MRNLIYTYEFVYDEMVDGFGCIQFCSQTKDEAIKLFTEWQTSNGYLISDYSVNLVYNEEDACEYGRNYGSKK